MNTRLNNPLLRALDSLLEGQITGWVLNLIIIPILVLLAIILPPVALPQRVLSAGYSGISPNTGGSVTLADGAQLSVPPGAIKSGASIRLTSQPRDAFLKSSLAKDLPPTEMLPARVELVWLAASAAETTPEPTPELPF